MNAEKRLGAHTIQLASPVAVLASGCAAGRKEGEGPLGKSIDVVYGDDLAGQDSWEKAESHLQRAALKAALRQGSAEIGAMDMVFAGDLLNQCAGSTFGLRESGVPFYGLYGACSTMAEALSLAAMCIDGGFAARAAAVTGSHYCSAEREYRMPLDYGGQRAPTAQWTVTGAGAVLLGTRGPGPFITHIATGKIVDAGITDAANMGAAMAPASVIIGPYPKGRCAGRVLQNTESKGGEGLYRQRLQGHNIYTVGPLILTPFHLSQQFLQGAYRVAGARAG
ncbi:MAG: hypothetical protein FWG72_10840 [Oscillospiraceae bacterium]|nr:hypothetical protein [Oscillospiraceae bacterium]